MKKQSLIPLLCGIGLFLLMMFDSSTLQLNQKLWWFDDIFHFMGGFIVAWFLLTLSPRMNMRHLLMLVFTIGIAWEFAEWWGEFYAPYYWPLYAQYMQIGTPFDTFTDLILDLLGGAMFFVLREKLLLRLRYAIDRFI